jgi:uncharacterized protein YwgA
MIAREDIVTAVVAAAGGQLTSRMRLQKSVYLLERLGLGSGFDYDYYHYGPYSRDLDNAAADAKAFELLDENYDYRLSDGARYSIFKLKPGVQPKAQAYGSLDEGKASEIVHRFAKTNVTVLELAATIDWLWHEENIADWRSEVKKRKAAKTEHGRLEQAVELLKELDLPPPDPAAAVA